MHKLFACLAILFSASAVFSAQDYPSRPVRVVVGFTPGGGTDFAARMVARILSEAWGQSAIVDNRPGASGNIGTDIVAKATPDGYTMIVSSPGPVVTNQFLFAKLPFDPQKDLAPVTLLDTSDNVIVVNPSAPVANMRDFIAWTRTKPGGVNYASSGIGATPHLAGELLNLAAGIKMVHVAYKSAGPAVIDIIGGRMDMLVASLPTSLGHIKAGRLKAIAVANLKRRSRALPDVPTVDESGVPGYEVVTWWGLFVPAGVPGNIVSKLNQAVVQGLKTPEIAQSFARSGADPVGSSPAELDAFVRKELAKWSRVIKAAGIKAN